MSSDSAVLGAATTGGTAAAAVATATHSNLALYIGLAVALAILIVLGFFVRRRSKRQ